MTTRPPFFLRAWLGVLLALACAGPLLAQYEMKSGYLNPLFRGPVPTDPDGTPPTLTPQFRGFGVTTGSSVSRPGVLSGALSARYPSQIYLDPATGQPTGAAIVLQRSRFGGPVAGGVPRYRLGDVIAAPSTQIGGVLPADSLYWRREPVRPGEVFVQPSGPQDAAPPVAANVVSDFYYSPHADRVFAAKAGSVTVTWVTRVPVAVSGDPRDAQTGARYRYRTETFAVSSATEKPVRTIYWTERSFNGPVVNVPAGSIEAVNPVYTSLFPAQVANEFKPVGISTSTDPSASAPAEKRTLWFEKTGGIGQLRAYNLEGRILVEYLGALKSGSTTAHEFLGADVVEVVRVAPVINSSVDLGEQILPRDVSGRALPADQSSEWLASPVINTSLDGQALYGSRVRPDGRAIYYAEQESENPDRVVFYWLERAEPAIRVATNPGVATPELFWPVHRNHYALRWPSDLGSYAHHTVAGSGGAVDTGIQFPSGILPELIYQDDPARAEASVDLTTQRLVVRTSVDGLNRTLLKFTNANAVWYVRLYTQSESRAGYEEGDGALSISGSAIVASRIEPPAGYLKGGYIAAGTGYAPDAYLNPFVVGPEAAEKGAIIPVNAIPGENTLQIWWFKRVSPSSAGFAPFYVPAKIGRYTVSYPAAPDKIVLASNAGGGDLPPGQNTGSLYIQNDRAAVGFNPNEEHAVLLGGRVYALRDDLNVTTAGPGYTSRPMVLLSYTDPGDQRPAMRAFAVERELDLPGSSADLLFDYPITAGTLLQGPMPLPLLPLPVDSAGVVRNAEVPGLPDVANQAGAADNARYAAFTYRDRKGYDWVYRGPHASGSPTLGMRFYYPMQAGFFIPGRATQPAVGTVLPYLRPLVGGVPQGDPVNGLPITVTYRPQWPDHAPELRVAETLTRPKFGLPDVFSQSSARVLYQQSVALGGEAKASVVLHDPIREKTYALGAPGGLAALPTSLLTTASGGKVYFQRLAPHLQSRLYFDPMRGARGSLVFNGAFTDAIAGEDYLDLNVLSAADLAAVKALVSATDSAAGAWHAAIDGLSTAVQTFTPDPLKAGSFRVGSTTSVGPESLPVVASSDTAVVDYALTATGAGQGWVTLLFGDGRAFTPEGEPVALKIIRVGDQLYQGDLKAKPSANPLDEQVTLRHSGDFAARPQDYEFEWRYAAPQDGVAPALYSYALASRLAADWVLVNQPAAALPSAAELNAGLAVTTPRSVVINPVAPADAALPGAVLHSVSGVDFSAGVPARLVFSARLGDYTGFVLYVNDVAALAYQAPAGFSAAAVSASPGLSEGALAAQFGVEPGFFRKGVNSLRVALFSSADPGSADTVDFRLEASTETELVTRPGSPWLAPNGSLSNQIVIGGSPSAPLGNPLLVMADNYFTLRYRPRDAANVAGNTAWSRWTQPVLVEGWVKRVLAAINPFNQRMSDLAENAVDTDVSLLTQAGKRWEGDIALSLSNMNDFGLIEIYETVLNRAKAISVDAGYDVPAVNDALLLAAGYLNDLYVILGNEAFADAANPTISVDDSATVTEVNTSRFSFESQVASVLDEELALLRGRDDFAAPGVAVAPAYNRLYWNFTRGINSGEALYAVNYNIREKAGSSTADGKIDAADAQRMFPQGHGDAYGHYLTALTGYYRLLQNPSFTWTPRSEAVTVLGQTVQVDYRDERKFAAAAASLARSAGQILGLAFRQAYADDPAAGWTRFRDGKVNSRTGATRHWGLDEWGARSIQGAYFHWVVGNALLPPEDTDPSHTGVQIVDRKTVPELAELAGEVESMQTVLDQASARLNPLGLSPGAIAFDISPADLKSGKTHYEQIHDRALRSVLNAKGAFDQAAKMTRLLRNQENQLDERNTAIVDEEDAYLNRLVEIYGRPYSGDVGAGKTYAQGYTGPDLINWFVIDRPTPFFDTSRPVSILAKVPTGLTWAGAGSVEALNTKLNTELRDTTVTVQPDRFAQYADTWANGASLGLRPVTGTLQQALLDVQLAHLALQEGAENLSDKYSMLSARHNLYRRMVDTHMTSLRVEEGARDKIAELTLIKNGLESTERGMQAGVEGIYKLSNSLAEFFPRVMGLANDTTAQIRAAIISNGTALSASLTAGRLGVLVGAGVIGTQIENVRTTTQERLVRLGFDYQKAQVAYEYELQLRELDGGFREVAALAAKLQAATAHLRNVIAEGERVRAERESFRRRAAALVQGYRTQDLAFRTFRNEALEQYRSLFDLAARYTYLSAKSYDYETGLLGTDAGRGVLQSIVASRSLGDLTGDTPQATVSTLGDAGLAGAMARLQADWSVAKGRLGINNPDPYGTLFSLRRELFRLRDDPAATNDDAAWRQTLEQHIVRDLLADPDIAAACRNLAKPDGSAVPGIVIPFRTTIEAGLNFFGLPLAAGDHAYSPSSFATKIHASGLVLRGYVGMNPYAIGVPNAGAVNSTAPDALSATPYVYLIPTGTDYQLAPPLGGTGAVRAWNVKDQALPLPFNLGASAFNTTQFFNADGTLSEQPWILRKHQAFRPVDDPVYFYSNLSPEFTNTRLVGRSVWNGGWKIVIPANTLLADEQEGLNRFVASVKDVELFLRTYSHSGN